MGNGRFFFFTRGSGGQTDGAGRLKKEKNGRMKSKIFVF